MKRFKCFSCKNKNQEHKEISIEQDGDKSNTIIGNVTDSFVGCTFNYDNIEPQWKERFDTYVAKLQEFKPETALSLLQELEKSFTGSKQQPSNELCAQILYQKGVCNRLLGNKYEMCQCFISAYAKNKLNVQIKEQAALAYLQIEDLDKADELAKELLYDDEYNIVAWYIIFLRAKTYDFGFIPKFVQQKQLFQQMLYNYFIEKNLYESILIMKELGMLPDFKSYNPQDVTINNFSENIFYINLLFEEYIRKYHFTFQTLNQGDIDILKKIQVLLKKILAKIEGSEIEKKYGALFFFDSYIKCVLTKEQAYISKMRNQYLQLESKNHIFALLCANVLQLNEQTDFALEILNDSELKESNILYLRAFCYLKKNDKIQCGIAIRDWINSVEKIDNYVVDNYLASIFTLMGIGETDELKLSDIIQNKKFENQELKTLIETIVKSLISGILDSTQISTLSELASTIQLPNLLLHIAYTFYYFKMYESAVDLYKKIVDSGVENLHLFLYIKSLYAAKRNSKELLMLLEHWRLNFSFQPDLLRIEADLCVIMHNWIRCLKICNTFLNKHEKDETFLCLKLRCLDLINENWCDSEIKSMAKSFEDYPFSIDQNIPIVASILVDRGCFLEGMEIFYKYSDKRTVRSAYLSATCLYSQKSQTKEIFKEFDEITDGCFVKYESNGEIYFFEMDKKNSDNFYGELLGHKLGDVISIKKMSSKDYSIRILRIMDKYLYLHDRILEEAKQPLSGLSMEAFNFTSSDPEEMKKDLISFFGEHGEQEELLRETAINKYYNEELSFTEVIIQAFRNEYLGGYTSLIYQHNGILLIPLLYYESLPQPVNTTNYVIDFSSLAILYQIAKEHDITYPHKFLISVITIDMIKQKLRILKSEPKSELSVVITNEDIIKYQIPENAHQNNIIYLEGLLKWIEKNCEAVVSPKFIDVKRNIDIDDNKGIVFDYIFNTSFVCEDKQAILLTDDFFYFKFHLPDIKSSMSTEKYIKNILGDEHPALFEFIKNKYRGYTLTTKQLLEEFYKKINSKDNYYTNCMENISMVSATPCVKLVDAITQTQLDINQQEIEIKNVFINILKNGPLSNQIIQGFQQLLYLELKYSQEKLDFVDQCLYDVYQMLGISIKDLKD
ncbi:hypothetical protein QYZ87_09225 [Porphyromonadaceae bacterium W3.11]|nr:hypothetical protein [Porphyromonadaceae bacterium W3.11]